MENKDFFNIPDIEISTVHWCNKENITTPWKYKSRLDPWTREFPEYEYKYSVRWHISGSHTFTRDNRNCKVEDSYSLVLENHTADDYLEYYRESVDLPYRYITISFSSNKPIDKIYFEDNVVRVYPSNKERLTEIFTNACRLFPAKPAGWQLEIKSILYEALTILFRAYINKNPIAYPKEMVETMTYIDNHLYDEKLCIKDLADNIHISNVHFSRLFSKTFGISPKQYIIKRKLEGVASSLKHTDMPINTVCDQMGFDDMSYFNKIFRKKYGMSPREYRKKQR